MADLNTGLIMKLLLSPLIWFVIIFGLIFVAFGILYVRKKKKLNIPCLIFTDLGSGKQGIEITKAGWFKSKSIILGLLDISGEQIMRIKDGRKVQGGSSIDFHEIKGKRGLLLKRKDDDPKVLVPLTRMETTNLELIAAIAPADFRDASNDILRSSEKEMKSKWEQYLPAMLIGGTIIFALVAIIIITQMVKNGQAEAADLIREAGRMYVNTKGSSAP